MILFASVVYLCRNENTRKKVIKAVNELTIYLKSSQSPFASSVYSAISTANYSYKKKTTNAFTNPANKMESIKSIRHLNEGIDFADRRRASNTHSEPFYMRRRIHEPVTRIIVPSGSTEGGMSLVSTEVTG